MYQHNQVMHGPYIYIYICNIKSRDSTGKETECVIRTLKKGNFMDHLKDKHGRHVTDLKELKEWIQLKRGGPASKDSQSYCQCHDCKKTGKPRKNATRTIYFHRAA